MFYQNRSSDNPCYTIQMYRMQTGYILFFFVFPIFSEGCCVKNYQHTKKGPPVYTAKQRYRVVEGEKFIMPCTDKKVKWSKVTKDQERQNEGFDCGSVFLIKTKHSGNYTLLSSEMFLHLQVLRERHLPCYKAEEGGVMLRVGAGGKIPCPGLTCTNSTDFTWYKVRHKGTFVFTRQHLNNSCVFFQGNRRVSEQHRASCEKNGLLHLCTVSHYDTGLYFCDKHFIEQGLQWTFRRAVNVTAIPYEKANDSPRITSPHGNTTEEVELGGPHTLTCQVHFPFEINFSAQVQWYNNYRGNTDNKTLLHTESQQRQKVTFKEFMVTERALIQQVTELHLNNTYTCIATNSVGNRSVTVKLKRTIKVKWPSLVGYPVAGLLLVAGLVIVLHVKWLELQLIYMSRFQHGKADDEEKDFDVFLSYVWTTPCAEASATLSSLSGPHLKDYLSALDLSFEGESGNQTPPEVLIYKVLEDLWGYRLCLLERDMLPGGAFTNDVVHALRRSQILICVISDDYLSNSDAVFVLESGIQVLLQSSALKILLIWTSKRPTSFIQPYSPLPSVVQRALKVLPSLDWPSGKAGRATSNFWRSLRKALPKHRVMSVTNSLISQHRSALDKTI
ncbi:interleukin-18 receptor accessory protein-like isoform X2 [Dunckerocampus dactyliophorus]|uniref:interleukin-18 receptor accessory protein-like isoform X2 n=1 Tax=Dunckerocampus dactyliophorus TaxID=161453 RepID=UPI002406D47B|nr:interleukin-18 receptor accessory protein-like isoform X2 [Dunckerocampus dactyliophorus]